MLRFFLRIPRAHASLERAIARLRTKCAIHEDERAFERDYALALFQRFAAS